MPVSKLWRVGGCIVLVVLGVILLFCAWGIYLIGSFDIYCEGALGVASLGSTVYVRTVDLETNFRYFQSNDNGYTWKTSSNIPQDVQDDLYRLSPKSTLACNPAGTKTCYRISARQNEFTDLEESTDGGQSWQQVPIPIRLSTKRGCYSPSGPRSLTFVKTNAANESYILVVAIDTNGVLMLTPEGTWTQHTIDKLHGRE